jgi:hypothetical protein
MAKFKSFLERELRKYGLWTDEQRVGESLEIDGNELTFSQLYTIYKDYGKWAYQLNMPGTWASFMSKLVPYIKHTQVKKQEKSIPSFVNRIGKRYACSFDSEKVKVLSEKILTSDLKFAHSTRTWAIAMVYYLTAQNPPTQQRLSQDYGISEVTLRRAVRKIEEL